MIAEIPAVSGLMKAGKIFRWNKWGQILLRLNFAYGGLSSSLILTSPSFREVPPVSKFIDSKLLMNQY
jgi:hypothetical protein